MQSIPIFPSKITTATFFGEFRLGLLPNNLGKTSSGFPKKREKRHPVTQKAGKTSSGYSKTGKTSSSSFNPEKCNLQMIYMNELSNETKQTYFCRTCDFTTIYKHAYARHLLTNRHKNMETGKKKEYVCDACNYRTNYKNDYTMHLSSIKHENAIKFASSKYIYKCSCCDKIYCNRQSLWRHKQKCDGAPSINAKSDSISVCDLDKGSDNSDDIESDSEKDADSEPDSDSSDSDDSYSGSDNDSSTGSRRKKKSKKHPKTGVALTPELVIELLKQNKELQTMLLEQHRNSAMSQSNNANSFNNTENSHNKTFNIQFFLNEHCKNAIDITEFVRTLDYTTESLASNMRLGYTGGISKMLTDKIKATPVEERPIHCCDEKREKLYIKNNGEWITGNDSKDILQSVIADIANQNYNTFRRWVSENPTCTILDTPAYEKFTMIYKGVIGATTDEEEIKHVKKILSNIIDEIKIEKEKYLR